MAPRERGKRWLRGDDNTKLFSVLCKQEIVRIKKIRWLMGVKSAKDFLKACDESGFLPESLIRDDDASFRRIKASIESMTSLLSRTQQNCHVVADYLKLFDLSMTSEPAIFVRTLSSALKHLKSDALEHVARVVTGSNNMCSTTRGAMRRAILGILPEMFLQSKDEGHLKTIKELSQIFKDPFSFRKQMTIITLATAPLLSAIENTTRKLDDVPTQALVAVNRKLDGETVVPQLPILVTCKRRRLLKKIIKKFKYLTPEEGDELPRPLAKAMSIMSMTLTEKERRSGTPWTEFFPFTPEVVALQKDILRAIWAIPKVTTWELKRLRGLLDPVEKLPSLTFRPSVAKYLLEYLYECDEIYVPQSVFKILSIIKKRSRRLLVFTTDEEVELVMNVSSRLKQMLWDSFPEDTDQVVLDACMSLESDDDDDGTVDVEDDIIIDGDEKLLCFVREGMDDSELADGSADSTDYIRSTTASTGGRLRCGGNATSKENLSFQSESQFSISPEHGLYYSIQSVCDDTSLLAHRLIDRVLEKLQTKGLEESEGIDEMSSRFLVQAIEELLPSFPQEGLDKAKRAMGITFLS